MAKTQKKREHSINETRISPFRCIFIKTIVLVLLKKQIMEKNTIIPPNIPGYIPGAGSFKFPHPKKKEAKRMLTPSSANKNEMELEIK
jgi:hypothetical protein